MAKTTIPGGYIEAGSIDTASLADTSITADKLHTTLDLTGKTVTVATATAGDNDTTVASTAFVSTAITNLAPLASPDFTGDATFDTSTLVIDSTNNRVGIGTDNPTVDLDVYNGSGWGGLDIDGTAGGEIRLQKAGTRYGGIYANDSTGLVLLAENGANETLFYTGGSERMRIDASGNVGIGTNNPGHPLAVRQSSGTDPQLHFETSAYGNAYGTKILVASTNEAATTSSFYNLHKTTASVNGRSDVQQHLSFVGSGASSDYQYWSTGGAERMRIDGAGNVGIGKTPNRSRKLEVAGDINLDNGYGLEWEDGGVGIVGSGATDVMTFATAGAERMRIESAGGVGMGTAGNANPDITSAGVTLQVAGPIVSGRAQGFATAGSNANKGQNIRNWYVFNSPSTNTSGNYVHMKTNLTNNAANAHFTMSCFTYHSYYAYGGNPTTGGYIGWHNWSGTLYNVHKVNNSTLLLLVQDSYTSSDSYVVLVALVNSPYAQFSIDWHQWAGYPFREAKVTAVSMSTSATGVY